MDKALNAQGMTIVSPVRFCINNSVCKEGMSSWRTEC